MGEQVTRGEEEHGEQRNRHDPDQEVGKGEPQRQPAHDRAKEGGDPEGGEHHARDEREDGDRDAEAAEIDPGGMENHRQDGGDSEEREPDPGGFSEGHAGKR